MSEGRIHYLHHFMQQLSNEMAAEYNIEFDQALAQFMPSSPTILPAAGVYFALLGVASRSP